MKEITFATATAHNVLSVRFFSWLLQKTWDPFINKLLNFGDLLLIIWYITGQFSVKFFVCFAIMLVINVIRDFLERTFTRMIKILPKVKTFSLFFATLNMYLFLLACLTASCNMQTVSLFVGQSIILNVLFPETLRRMFVITTARSELCTDFGFCDIKCFFDSFALY